MPSLGHALDAYKSEWPDSSSAGMRPSTRDTTSICMRPSPTQKGSEMTDPWLLRAWPASLPWPSVRGGPVPGPRRVPDRARRGSCTGGQRTINDGQRYVDTVGPLVDSPEVQQRSRPRSPTPSRNRSTSRRSSTRGLRRRHHRQTASGSPRRTARRRDQRPDRLTGAILHRLRRVRRLLGRREHQSSERPGPRPEG